MANTNSAARWVRQLLPRTSGFTRHHTVSPVSQHFILSYIRYQNLSASLNQRYATESGDKPDVADDAKIAAPSSDQDVPQSAATPETVVETEAAPQSRPRGRGKDQGAKRMTKEEFFAKLQQEVEAAKAAKQKHLDVELRRHEMTRASDLAKSKHDAADSKRASAAGQAASVKAAKLETRFIPAVGKAKVLSLHQRDPEYWTSERLASELRYPLLNVKAILKLAKIQHDLEKRLLSSNAEALKSTLHAAEIWETLAEPAPALVPPISTVKAASSTSPRFELFDPEIQSASESLRKRGIGGSAVKFLQAQEEEKEQKLSPISGGNVSMAADGSATGSMSSNTGAKVVHTKGPGDNWIQASEAEADKLDREESKRCWYRHVLDYQAPKFKKSQWVIVDTTPSLDNDIRTVVIRDTEGKIRVATPLERKKALSQRGVVFTKRTGLEIY